MVALGIALGVALAVHAVDRPLQDVPAECDGCNRYSRFTELSVFHYPLNDSPKGIKLSVDAKCRRLQQFARGFAALFLVLSQSCSLESIASGGVTPSYVKRSCTKTEGAAGGTKHIFVVNIGWHTGLMLLSTEAGELPLPEFRTNSHVEIGWGDGDFYRASGYSYWKGFRALFFPGEAVIHSAGFQDDAENYFRQSEVIELAIAPDRYQALMKLVEGSLLYDENHQPIAVGRSLYGNGHFYRAAGHTGVCRTCNTWNAEALRTAGCDVAANLVRSSSLMRELRKLPPTPISTGEAQR